MSPQYASLIQNEDSVILSEHELETLTVVYQLTELRDPAQIAAVEALCGRHPELVVMYLPADQDLDARIEAMATAKGRSQINAFMVGQASAYRQVGEIAADCACAVQHHPAAHRSPNDEG